VFDKETPKNTPVSERCIAVVSTLTPRVVLHAKEMNVAGFLFTQGGSTSHAAILCRALEITAVNAQRKG